MSLAGEIEAQQEDGLCNEGERVDRMATRVDEDELGVRYAGEVGRQVRGRPWQIQGAEDVT